MCGRLWPFLRNRRRPHIHVSCPSILLTRPSHPKGQQDRKPAWPLRRPLIIEEAPGCVWHSQCMRSHGAQACLGASCVLAASYTPMGALNIHREDMLR